MKVWITGGAGFLGSRLAQSFSSLGYEVTSLSRRACPFASRSVSIDLAADSAREKLQELSEATGAPEVLIHAASLQPGFADLSKYVRANVLAAANLLDALKSSPPRQIIYTSTHSVYSRPEVNPVKETHPTAGPLPYAATKQWGEQVVESFKDRAHVVILRLPSLYGSGQADSFIDGLARLALKNEPIELFLRGNLIRDALHVTDVVRAIVSCVTSPSGERFSCLNLGCGQPITTGEYAQALVEALGSSSVVVPVDRPSSYFDLYADIEEARRQIGWTPTGLRESLRGYVDELRTRS